MFVLMMHETKGYGWNMYSEFSEPLAFCNTKERAYKAMRDHWKSMDFTEEIRLYGFNPYHPAKIFQHTPSQSECLAYSVVYRDGIKTISYRLCIIEFDDPSD